MEISKCNYCTKCGQQLKPGARFCSACGAEISMRNKTSQANAPKGKKVMLICGVIIAVVILATLIGKKLLAKGNYSDPYKMYVTGYYHPEKLPNYEAMVSLGGNSSDSAVKSGDQFAFVEVGPSKELCMVVVDDIHNDYAVWDWSKTDKTMYYLTYTADEVMLFDEDSNHFYTYVGNEIRNGYIEGAFEWIVQDGTFTIVDAAAVNANINDNTSRYEIDTYVVNDEEIALALETKDQIGNLQNSFAISSYRYGKMDSYAFSDVQAMAGSNQLRSADERTNKLLKKMQNINYFGSRRNYNLGDKQGVMMLYDTPEEAYEAYKNGEKSVKNTETSVASDADFEIAGTSDNMGADGNSEGIYSGNEEKSGTDIETANIEKLQNQIESLSSDESTYSGCSYRYYPECDLVIVRIGDDSAYDLFAFCINGNDINDRVYIGNERTTVAVVPESKIIIASHSLSCNETEFMTYIVDEYIDISADITRRSNEDGETSYFINSFCGEYWGEYSEKGYDYLIEYSGGGLSDVNNNGMLYIDGMRIIQYYQVYPTLKEAMENPNNY